MKKNVTLYFTGLILLVLATYYHIFVAAWFGFAFLFFPAYKNPNWLRDGGMGILMGIIYWSFHISSVIPAYGWSMFSKLVFFASVPWGILLLCVSIAAKKYPPSRSTIAFVFHTFLPGILWLGMMRAYHFTPADSFPLEPMFYQPLPLLQITVLGGFGLVIFLILLFNTSLALSIAERKMQMFLPGALSAVLLMTIALWGWNRLETHPPQEGDTRVALIQTNFPVDVDWRTEHKEEILRGYTDMALEAAKNDVQMIIFPQYSLSTLLSDEETISRFGALARRAGTYVALGTFTLPTEEHPEQYNVAYVFNDTGELAGTYKAMKNLPFREIGESFGTGYDPIATPAGDAGVLLCYEDAIRNVSALWNTKDIDYFIVLTNPNTFASSYIRNAQLQQDQMRAIETGKEIVRVLANGPSGVVDRYGRLRTVTRHEEKTIVYSTVSGAL